MHIHATLIEELYPGLKSSPRSASRKQMPTDQDGSLIQFHTLVSDGQSVRRLLFERKVISLDLSSL
jgi:hypothetical protein